MKLNIEELRQHYASLSDEALRAINRAELVEIARECYDHELAQREPLKKTESLPKRALRVAPLDEPEQQEDMEEAAEDELEEDGGADPPEWLEEAACVCTFAMFTGGSASVDAENARDVLTEAGIPCHVTLQRIEPSQSPPPRSEYRVMVPGGLNLDAASVLDKEIFNAEIEAEWQAHFSVLSDEDLLGVNQERAC
jgi:hypothetical protein